MTYDILLGDPGYSSWSMRPWLILDRFAIPHRIRWIPLYTDAFVQAIGHPPARTVPVLLTPDGDAVRDSLAIIETLAERHPEHPVWPADPRRRAEARSLAAEMHAGFAALRSECPMNLRVAQETCQVGETVIADLARIETLWEHALAISGGPWLLGDWSAADAMFAPVAARVAGYALPVGKEASDYVMRHLCDPGFRRWRAMGLTEGPDLHPAHYPAPDRAVPWPGPHP